MLCRRICVVTKAFPLATDCKMVTASTELEALSVVSIVCYLLFIVYCSTSSERKKNGIEN